MTDRWIMLWDKFPRWAALVPRRFIDPGRASMRLGEQVASLDMVLQRNARALAGARVLLALGNALVLSLDPSQPSSDQGHVPGTTYGAVLALILYAFCVWWWADSGTAPSSLRSLTAWLDALFSSVLIWSTGAHNSPFYVWVMFTILGAALQNGWRTAVRVALALIVLYVAICLPGLAHHGLALGIFVVRTFYLLVIALVLAYMGQRLLEQNQSLAGLHRATTHLSAGGSQRDILGRLTDTLVDLLETERVAVATWENSTDIPRSFFVNLNQEQGRQLLGAVRDWVVSTSRAGTLFTLISNDPSNDDRFPAARQVLPDVRNLLITRLPSSHDSVGVLVACNRLGGRRFTRIHGELADLLAAHAGALLEKARLQEQRCYHAGLDERRRIAAELHDGLTQTLASLDLRILRGIELWRNHQWEALGDELVLLKLIAEEALRESRGAVNEMGPVRLSEGRLTLYLNNCLQRFQHGLSVPVEVSIDLADSDVPEPTALLLIGLLREGLNNVRKYAQASRVVLRITQDGDQIMFRLADNGVGFRPEEPSSHGTPTEHYGLAYLQEHVTRVGGEMRVTSSLGVGTVLEACVPLLTEERLVALLSRTAT
jgi:signal transduction histidine kinase